MRIIIETDEAGEVSVAKSPQQPQEQALDAGPPDETLLTAIGGPQAVAESQAPQQGQSDAGGPPVWLEQVIEGGSE